MQRWIPWMAAVLLVQLLVAGALALRKDALVTSPPDAPFVTASIRTADRIVLEGRTDAAKGAPARVELVRQGGRWVVHSDFDVPAAQAKVMDLLTRLAALRRGLPIADTKDAIGRFKVADANFARRLSFSSGGKTLATLYFGESAGFHKSDARANGERAVYTVGIATYDLPVDAAGWVDGSLLQIPPSELAEIDVGGAHGARVTLTRTLTAGKPPGPWSAAGLPRGRTLDDAKVDALARAIGAIRLTNVLGDRADPNWQADHPAVELTIKNPAGKAVTWTLAKPKSGDFTVLKSSAERWYYSLTADQAKPLLDAGSADGLAADIDKGKSRAKPAAAAPHESPKAAKPAH